MRKEFGKFMVDIAGKDDAVYLLIADTGFSIFDEFKKKYPDRFLNIGICEQSLIGVAAGLALSGLKPYVYAISPFLLERPYEQVKLDIDQQNVNVKLIGYDNYPGQGPTHKCADKKVLMSAFKNIQSYFPIDSIGVRKVLDESYHRQQPTFISLNGE